MRLIKSHKRKKTPEELKEMALAIIGQLTDPDILQELREEIDNRLGHWTEADGEEDDEEDEDDTEDGDENEDYELDQAVFEAIGK